MTTRCLVTGNILMVMVFFNMHVVFVVVFEFNLMHRTGKTARFLVLVLFFHLIRGSRQRRQEVCESLRSVYLDMLVLYVASGAVPSLWPLASGLWSL